MPTAGGSGAGSAGASGGSSGSRGSSANGNPMARSASFTMGLNSARGEARRNEDGMRDAELRDDSSLANTRPSPLELPQQSYAQAHESQEQRAREAKMKQTAEQFVGAPTVPSVDKQENIQTEEEPQSDGGRITGEEEQREDEDAPDPAQVTQQINQAKAMELRNAERNDAIQTNLSRSQKKAKEQQEEAMGIPFRLIANSLFTTSLSGEPFSIFSHLLMINGQFLNTFRKDYGVIPRPTVSDFFKLIFVDLMLILVVLLIIGFITALISVAGAAKEMLAF